MVFQIGGHIPVPWSLWDRKNEQFELPNLWFASLQVTIGDVRSYLQVWCAAMRSNHEIMTHCWLLCHKRRLLCRLGVKTELRFLKITSSRLQSFSFCVVELHHCFIQAYSIVLVLVCSHSSHRLRKVCNCDPCFEQSNWQVVSFIYTTRHNTNDW